MSKKVKTSGQKKPSTTKKAMEGKQVGHFFDRWDWFSQDVSSFNIEG